MRRLARRAGRVGRGQRRGGRHQHREIFAPHALAAFAKNRPGIDLRLSVGNRTEIIDGLRRYELDLAVMGRPPQEMDVEAAVIGDHPHVIVARPDHPLAGERALAPRRLAGETFLVREPGSGTRGLMEQFFADSRVTPRLGMQIGSNETIKQAVIAGIGIAFLSAHTIGAEVESRRLSVLSVAGLPIVRQWYVVHLRERHLMPAAHLLRRFLTLEGRLHLPSLGAQPGSAARAISPRAAS